MFVEKNGVRIVDAKLIYIVHDMTFLDLFEATLRMKFAGYTKVNKKMTKHNDTHFMLVNLEADASAANDPGIRYLADEGVNTYGEDETLLTSSGS